ncbi:MAG: TAT-variant-translocated molybdopterin oxidoreductase [Phycisphaerales bacterium]|nr:TAT-variant-translocated molybdopterin oxidoreductase [Phycisphaerales bacterium]
MSPVVKNKQTGRAYWRSLDELSGSPEFQQYVDMEFPDSALDGMTDADRRSFLKLMAGSMAMAGIGLTGCRRWPKEEIVPYAHRPNDRTPGVAERYATSMELGGVAGGLMVTSFEGRPTKIEGNPNVESNMGTSGVFEQGSILDLYDPDRSRRITYGTAEELTEKQWKDFERFTSKHFRAVRSEKGQGFAVLAEASSSPSVAAMRARLESVYPNMSWCEYEPLNNDGPAMGTSDAMNGSFRAVYDLKDADVILTLDADILGVYPDQLRNIRDFTAGRRVRDGQKSINRLITIEPTLTLTGSNADDRVAMRRGDVQTFAAGLSHAIMAGKMKSSDHDQIESLAKTNEQRGFAEKVANDLMAHKGRCVVIAGPGQGPAVHRLAHGLNEALGNVGKTVRYAQVPSSGAHAENIASLAEQMNKGDVSTLVLLGGNPVYDAPADLKFADAIKKVKTSIHLSDYENETSVLCSWHLNRAHYLESWGDGRTWDGTVTFQQPLIEPLFGGHSSIELLALIAGEAKTAGYDIVRNTMSQDTSTSTNDATWDPTWRKVLYDGHRANSAFKTGTPKVNMDGVQAKLAEPSKKDQLELIFTPDTKVYDGRYANNGWLQELPDPLTRLTWDNALLISPWLAKEKGLAEGTMVKITANGASMTAPVIVQPGQARHVVSISLGYGRSFPGRISTDAGFNAYPLRTTKNMWSVPNVTVESLNETYPLARVQNHYALDSVGGKGEQQRIPMFYRETELADYQAHPNFANADTHVVHSLNLWQPRQFDGADYAWAMSIDLNACTGCGTCVMACQAENNLPIVGKDQIIRGREMHWIRVDRYYTFAESSPGSYDPEQLTSVALQPMTCQHCENAPCEQVCPVAATVHDNDGLNVMVYNRCVGTRYCSNNCPYKVRRFNYFDYFRRDPAREGGFLAVNPDYYIKRQSGADPLRRMQFNPEVTVRMRGVMEKCTYCTQRIQAAKIEAKNAWVQLPKAEKEEQARTWVKPPPELNANQNRIPIPDGTIVPACAQACPAGAITFGDLLDPNSEVARQQNLKLSYSVLEEINIRPRTKYLAKVTNPLTAEAENGAHGHAEPGHTEHAGEAPTA